MCYLVTFPIGILISCSGIRPIGQDSGTAIIPMISQPPTTMAGYLDRLRTGLTRLQTLLTPDGRLVLLIGDGRKSGVFYPIHADVIQWRVLSLDAILIKEGDHARRARHFRYGPTRFIPTLHEFVLIFKRGESCMLPSMPE